MTGFDVKGWCPGALRPMMSGDGLVVRIRPRLARLTADQAQGIARAALTHGNGLIDLSARANVQLRGIRPDAHMALLADLRALGLIDPDEVTEAHRNIVVSPFWSDQDGTETVVQAVMLALAHPAALLLPGKFGFAVDLGGRPVLQSTSADIRIEAHPQGWLLRPDTFSTGTVVNSADALQSALIQLIQWFVASGCIVSGRGRMADLGPDIRQRHPLPDRFSETETAINAAAKPGPGPHPNGHLIGFEFGQMRAETLANLAQGPIRVTPWRMILLEGVAIVPDLAGIICDPGDPRLRVTACTGAPGCPQALQPTRSVAHSLAPQVPQGQHLHVSGCAKGCAHPSPAAITLCGTRAGFDLIRNGRASDAPNGQFDASTPLFKAL